MCLRKEMFSPEKSFSAEKWSRGVMFVARTFSSAFIEYSSLRYEVLEDGLRDNGRKSSDAVT